MKGFSISNAVILGIIALVLILVFLQTAQKSIRNISDSSICKESVKLNALLRYDKETSTSDIKCPILFVKTDSDKQNVVFQSLALALSDTWNEFFEGRVQVFDVEKQNFCVIRRVIEFNTQGKFNGLFSYLIQNNPPAMRKSYFTYLTNIGVEEGQRTLTSNFQLRNADVIDTSTPYAAVFVMAKRENIGKITGAEIGGATGLITLGVASSVTGVGLPIGLTLIGAGTAGGAYTGFLLGSDYVADWDAGMLLVPYTEQSLKALNCTKLPVSLTDVNRQ